TDQAAALATVADPDLIVSIGPDVVGLGEGHGDVVLDDPAGLRIELAELAGAEAAVPDDPGGVDAQPADRRRLRERRILGELLRLGIELRDLAAPKLGEPEVFVPVQADAVRRRARRRHFPHPGLLGLAVPLAEHVAADDGEPDVFLRVDDRRVAPGALALAGGVHRIPEHRTRPRIEAAQMEA